ncbi:murein hydrolase activator EnvC family protein [Novosphingopyxis sp.]|uniref:murein hydrolase activator EnvC family protein n=1 Tax=Novosphingopyxis sp. TaxID=2709690 RepID=UPI003B5B29A4
MVRAIVLLVMLPLLVGAAPSGGGRTVADAEAEAIAADARSDALRVRAELAERDVRRTATRRRALERQIAAEETKLREAKAALGRIGRRRAEEERRLAVAREPLMRLTGALERFSRQPAGYALVRPGSTRELVHVRAILDSTIPRIEARTQETRTAIRRIETLRAAQAGALGKLAAARTALADRRRALARAEVDERHAAARLLGGAVQERARALALGEEARDIVATEERDQAAGDVLAVLSQLPPPPLPVRGAASRAAAAYRLPVGGKVAGGFGEASRAGYRARGVTIAAGPGAAVVAPAAGRVRFAGRYRSFGDIVIVDHGAGWTSLLTGLDRLSVRKGQTVRAGEPLGRAGGPVTVELRRKGRPVDVAAML